MDVAEFLETAIVALDAEDSTAAIVALVEAWRLARHPRIAELASRVSSDEAPRRPKIEGKTVAATTAAWLELEKVHDVVDVERLLAAPWPSKWTDGLTRLECIARWSDDPRVAKSLTQALADPPYTSQASYSFTHKLILGLLALDDVRARDALAPAIERFARSASYRVLLPQLEAHSKEAPALDERAELVLERLEQRFASTLQSEGASQKTSADFLAEIWAHPDDRASKSVFADWLSERGDPRGELITIGLARSDGNGTKNVDPKAERRERALVAKVSEDHDAWEWPVAQLFKRGTRRYEDGFFAGGLLVRLPPADQPLHPAWGHVRFIELDDDKPRDLAFFERPELRLREIYNMAEQSAVDLLQRGAFANLEALEIVEEGGRDRLAADDPLTTCAGAPRLRSLGVCCPRWRDSAMMHLARWAVVERLTRITVRNSAGKVATPELVASFAARSGPLELEIHEGPSDKSIFSTESAFVFTRDKGRMPFRALLARSDGSIARLLGDLPEGSLEMLRVEPGRGGLRAGAARELQAAVARFPGIIVDPPIEGAAATPVPAADAIAVRIRLRGTSLCTPERVPQALELARRLGVAFDSFSFGHGGAHRKLGRKPAEQLATWAKKKGLLRIYRDGGTDSMIVDQGALAHSSLDAAIQPEVARTLLEWITSVVESLDIVSASIEVGRPVIEGETEAVDPFGLWRAWPGWLLVMSGRWCDWLTDAALLTLRDDAQLRGLVTRRTERNLLVGLTPSPAEPPTGEQIAAFAKGLRRIVQVEWANRRGYSWADLGRAMLEKTCVALDLEPTTDVQEDRFTMKFGNATRLSVKISEPFGEPTITSFLESEAGVGFYAEELGTFPAGSRALAEHAFAEIARSAVERGPGCFAAPAPPPRRRR